MTKLSHLSTPPHVSRVLVAQFSLLPWEQLKPDLQLLETMAQVKEAFSRCFFLFTFFYFYHCRTFIHVACICPLTLITVCSVTNSYLFAWLCICPCHIHRTRGRWIMTTAHKGCCRIPQFYAHTQTDKAKKVKWGGGGGGGGGLKHKQREVRGQVDDNHINLMQGKKRKEGHYFKKLEKKRCSLVLGDSYCRLLITL